MTLEPLMSHPPDQFGKNQVENQSTAAAPGTHYIILDTKLREPLI